VAPAPAPALRGQSLRARSLLALALCLHAWTARADGAFPDESALFFPPRGVNRVVLTTNFGLLLSNDALLWSYVCEQPAISPAGANVNLYQVSDEGMLLADFGSGLARSIDGACNWSAAGGAATPLQAIDAAFDPTLPGFAIALISRAFGLGEIRASNDNGATFGPAIWSGGAYLTGVEFSRARPGRLYVSGLAVCAATGSGAPFLLRSDDRGATFATFDLASLGTALIRIAAVDPVDPDTLYLRATDPQSGAYFLLWSKDAARSLQVALAIPAPRPMSAFLRADDGTLYAGTRQSDLFTLPPHGTAWQHAAGGPHFRCLAEHGGQVYACADDQRDGMALGIAPEPGVARFCPLFRFRQINGLLGCANIQSQCASSWASISSTLGIVGPSDAGTPCLDLMDAGPMAVGGTLPFQSPGACTISALSDAGIDAGAPDGGSAPRVSKGCGCGSNGAPAQAGLLLLASYVVRSRNWRRARSTSVSTARPNSSARRASS
jgi:uncharacterized protein (TIGR03382 family)